MSKFYTTIPLSLYIHLPWCVQKCPYCDFNSHKAPPELPETLYIKALIEDFEEQLPTIWGRRLTSIFFGGGTPSLFSALSIDTLLRKLNSLLPFHSDLEITLEANPGTVDESRFKDFRATGINRLSLGLQSLQNEKLKSLGRIHDRDRALKAIEIARDAGFDNFNLDLMHGLPNQSVEDALQDLQDALAFKPKHLSWYQLTIEPNTMFHHTKPTLPSDEIIDTMQTEGKNLLSENGFLQYEVSAYSQPDFRCQHNLNYWQFGDYLGIGAGAHSKITDINNQCIKRHWQVKNPKDYLDPQKKFVAEEKILTKEEIVFEFMLNALRLTDGISVQFFLERTGMHLKDLQKQIDVAIARGLLKPDANGFYPTELGKRFLNDLTAIFL